MSRRIERLHTVEPGELRRLACAAAEQIREGATIVDDDAQGPTGIDLILAGEDGSPVLVDIVGGDANAVPTRLFEHVEWMEANARLFQRAYAGSGLVRVEHPVFVFVAPEFPEAVTRAVSAVEDVSVELVRATPFLVDSKPELLLERVEYQPRTTTSRAVTRRTQELDTESRSSFESKIESEGVRSLFSLFKSGVDGLDGRIAAVEHAGGVVFELDGHRLAAVGVSPGSFTVATGDPSLNPIVVSDRISLERALNAVISFFVREGQGSGNGEDVATDEAGQERGELRRIWGDGITRDER